jgi:hypothetical protein
MERLSRYYKRGKEKTKNKLMPYMKQSTAASREGLTGGSDHSGASSSNLSHPTASMDPTAAERTGKLEVSAMCSMS